MDEGQHNYIENSTIFEYFHKFQSFLTESKTTKYTQEEIRELRIKNIKVQSETETEQVEEIEEAQNETVESNITKVKVLRPRLFEFSTNEVVEAETLNSIIQEEGLTREDIRKKRLEAMKKSKQ